MVVRGLSWSDKDEFFLCVLGFGEAQQEILVVKVVVVLVRVAICRRRSGEEKKRDLLESECLVK